MASYNLESILDIWDAHFSDVPWVEQSVLVPVNSSLSSRKFQFVLENTGELPEFELIGGHSCGEPKGVNHHLTVQVVPDGSGVILTLSDDAAPALSGIRVRQRGAPRNARLVCLQHDDEKHEWLVIYNTFDRAKHLLSTINPMLSRPYGDELTVLIRALLSREMKRADVLLHTKPRILADVKGLSRLLAKFALETTSHGLKRTFRFWTEVELRSYLEEAVDAASVITELTSTVCLFGGIALGWQRHGSVLAHDDDVDILVALERCRYGNIGDAMEVVARSLEDAGWKIKAYFFNHLWVTTRYDEALTFDVFVGLIEEERVSCYTLPRKGLEAGRVFPAETHLCNGVLVPLPRDLPHYLEVNFGSGWTVPDPNYRPNWDRRRYADVAGDRKYVPMMTRGEVLFERERLANAEAGR